jgi:hypothetical protein
MIEVQATHITNARDPRRRSLVCELYPGILLIHGQSGAMTVNTFGRRVERLPKPQRDRTFPSRRAPPSGLPQ